MNTLKTILSVLFLGACFAFLFWSTTPGILRDWRLRDHYAPVEANIGGDCRAYAGVVTFCDTTLTLTGHAPVKETLLFVDFHLEDYSVMAVGAPEDPNLLSTDLAMKKYWNRVATLGFFVAIFALMMVGGAMKLLGVKPRQAQPQGA